MLPDRVVAITGLGVISPLGIGWKIFWDSLLKGQNGIGPITTFDASDYSTRFAAEVKDFEPTLYVTKKDARRMDRTVQFSVAAASMALEDSGLTIDPQTSERTGVIIGSGIGGMHTFENQESVLLQNGPNKVSPFFIPMMIPNMPSGQVSIQLGLKGPNFGVVSACASGTHALSQAADVIRTGRADVMLAGGAEAAVTPLCLAGFCAMRALSTRNDDPSHASRPFDKQRDGFVVGEGAGVLVLEELEHALARNANIYAILAGCGNTADAFHITSPDPEGLGAMRAMDAALKDAGIAPNEVNYINAHGTSTGVGDPAETKAIKGLFGENAYKIAVSSTKSMTGHALGATGAIETVVAVLTVKNDIIPPTINYEYPDPDCDLDYVPCVARKATVNVAMNNSFGFGGQNSVVLVRKFTK